MLYDLMKARRSIRKYQDKKIEQEKVDILLRSALVAPSSRGRKPCEFISVTDPSILQELSQCRDHGPQFIADAPLGIVIIADTEVSDVWIEDASIAATFIQLTAQELGLGSCWIQVRERFHTEQETAGAYIKNVLDIPDRYAVACMIAVGYPAEEKEGYQDSDLPYDKLHVNRF